MMQRRSQSASRLWLALICLLAVPGQGVCAGAMASQPSPGLSPKQVVEIQLTALQNIDLPEYDAGMAIVYRFASPENRGQTGPLPRFSQMLREGYPEMINHRSHSLLLPVLEGDEALMPVELTTRGGRVVRYVFILRQQREGLFKDCWMTDGVVLPEDQPKARET